MASAALEISVVEKRMLRQSEAADYTGLPVKHFKSACPVRPIELSPGSLLSDKRDLDTWIDSFKDGAESATIESIVGRL